MKHHTSIIPQRICNCITKIFKLRNNSDFLKGNYTPVWGMYVSTAYIIKVTDIFLLFSKIRPTNLFQQRPGSDSCSKLPSGYKRSDILSSRHRTIGRTFWQISAAIGRISREILCRMCVILYCSSLFNKVFLGYIIWV